MKKILLISYLFAPNNEIGALRPTKIAGLLSERGNIVDVVSYGLRENDSLRIPLGIHNHFTLNKDRPYPLKKRKKNIPLNKLNNTVLNSLKQHYRKYLLLKRDNDFIQYCTRLYENNLAKNNYDVLITSFGPPASLVCGLYIKQSNPDINWICEFRDPVLTEDVPILFRPYYWYIQNTACRKADHIVAVSNGYVKRICGNKYTTKRHMIPNGYDKSDLLDFQSQILSKDKLHIIYVGALYEGKRKITPLFQVIRELIDENQLSIDKICFDYAGRDVVCLYDQAKVYDLKSVIVNHGLLSRQECLELQLSSNLLVLSTWNNKGEEGVFPGKFLEYMLIRKPIISLTDGNLSNGEVSQVMREGNFGVAYEAANSEVDIKGLKSKIKSWYLEWLKRGSIEFNPSQSVLSRYDYENIINEIEKLL